jgi:hypothetical protein
VLFHLKVGVTSSLTPTPIFRRKLKTPEAAGIEPFDSDLPGLRGPGLPDPYDLKLSGMATIDRVNRNGLVHLILASCLYGRPEFADADRFCIFCESLPARINSADLDAASELEPRRPSLRRLRFGSHNRPPSLFIGEVLGVAAGLAQKASALAY